MLNISKSKSSLTRKSDSIQNANEIPFENPRCFLRFLPTLTLYKFERTGFFLFLGENKWVLAISEDTSKEDDGC